MLRQSAVLLLCASFILGHPENRPVQSGAQPPRVTTPLGEIEGAVLRTRLGKPIYAFRGIRYAKPPINELRFKVIALKLRFVPYDLIFFCNFSPPCRLKNGRMY